MKMDLSADVANPVAEVPPVEIILLDDLCLGVLAEPPPLPVAFSGSAEPRYDQPFHLMFS
jgi:hypothetical protein